MSDTPTVHRVNWPEHCGKRITIIEVRKHSGGANRSASHEVIFGCQRCPKSGSFADFDAAL